MPDEKKKRNIPEPPPSLFRTLLGQRAKWEHPIRRKQIEQFMYPNQDIFPRTDLRPTSLTKFQDRTFRSMKDYIPRVIELPDYISGVPFDLLEEIGLPYSVDQNARVLVPSQHGSAINIPLLTNSMGLGEGTVSIGKDPKTNQPYMSIFDSWDFDEPGSGFEWTSQLRKSGVPFNIYDRIPLKMDNGKIRRIQTTKQSKDVLLPYEGNKKRK